MKLIQYIILSLTLTRSRLIATNEAREFAVASNELALDGEWMKISPYGDFPNKVGLQRVTKADAELMVTAFNSLRGRASRLFMGLPIYVGHPDVEPGNHADKRRYGKITDLEAREDGFYGKVALNSLGKAAIDEGHYLFNSPAWYLKREGKFVRPVELISIGLTNTPQIPGEPWAKNETTEGQNMPTWLKELLVSKGLLKPEATEDECKTAVNSLVLLPARVTELQGQLTTAQNEKTTVIGERDQLKTANTTLTGERDALRTRELDFAVNCGRISQAERAAWNDKLAANLTAGLTELDAKKATVATNSRVSGTGQRKETESSVQGEKIVAINTAVRKYATDHNLNLATNEGYNQAFAGVRQSQPALFA
jgi:FtsZ-binding cell division protein ZapB